MVHSSSVAWTTLDDESLVAHPDREERFRFADSAALLWNRLESPSDFADLVGAVMHVYAVSRDEAERDVSRFVNSLIERDLLDPVRSSQ